MSREPLSDDAYLDLRAQQHADKSFMGGTRLSTRTALFFFVGVLAMVAFAAMYYHSDQRLSHALGSWKEAQRVAGAVTELSRAIDDVRVFDARVRDNGDPIAMQGHRRAVDRVVVALDTLQRIPQTDPIRDPIITTRDAFANYGEEFTYVADTAAKLGMTENSGLNGQRRDIATAIRELMKGNGLGALLGDFDALDAAATADPAPTESNARAAIGDSYRNITRLLDRSVVGDEIKNALNQQLQRHATVVATILDIKTETGGEFPPFADILDYVSPSLRAITDFSEQFGRAAPAAFERENHLVRQIIVIGSAGILAFLVLFGVIMLRSITAPLRRLSEATLQLADGDRAMSLPLRGNQDSIGDMARALDVWQDHMAEVDHLRAELDDARMRLALGAIAEAVERPGDEPEAVTSESEQETKQPAGGPQMDAPGVSEDVSVTAKQEEVPQPVQPPLPPEPTLQPPPSLTAAPPPPSPSQPAFGGGLRNLPPEPGMASSDRLSSPIGSASKQLSQFSEFVTDAAQDVERTETLIQALGETTRHLAELESCVAIIRDEANLLVFRTPNRGAPSDDETLVYLPGGEAQNPPDGRRFDAIRQTVNRAERLIVSAQGTLDTVNVVAQEIATAASSQALDATNKLLSQSEYLQNMLDDLVHKLGPVTVGNGYGADTSRSGRKGDGDS